MKNNNEVDFHYLKMPGYRTYHVDGFFGGLTPRGTLYMELFVERAVTPQLVRHKIADDGTLGEEVKREGKSGVVREVECGIALDINAAKSCRDWLDDKIKEHEKLIKEGKKK